MMIAYTDGNTHLMAPELRSARVGSNAGTLSLPGVAASVGAPRRFVDAALAGAGLPRAVRHDMLVVGELTTNAVIHGSRAGDRLEIAYEVDAHRVTVRVLDAARSGSGPVCLSPDERRPPGRRLQIVQSQADWSERIVVWSPPGAGGDRASTGDWQ